ncbi:MAG: pyruvate kinase [Clostridiales bacterium]|nr:pyruvate kinase [Clostridiales bacterium]
MKKTKIVCTLGPASESKETLKEMIKAGMNVARLNFSHGTHEEHKKRIDLIKEIRQEMDVHVAILLDTKGPEIRTGKFDKEEIILKEGSYFTLTVRDIIGNDEISSVTYAGLVNDVKIGDKILIDDGLIELVVEEIKETDIKCRVLNSGIVKNHKGINLPGVKINLPAVTSKDEADILFGIENDIDFIAASFVRRVSDVLDIKRILEHNNASDIGIIAKIENQEGVDNIDDILSIADGIMVARGDLGVEIKAEEIPIIQKRIIRRCNLLGKPVITATQMLDSMIRNPRPTRAEVTDVANAIFDGSDAVMLSGETAAGKYPVESVKTMANIALQAEAALNYEAILREKGVDKALSITDAVSHATCTSAQELGAAAILTATSSGYTSMMVSKFRPKPPVIAATSNPKVARKMSLVWGTVALLRDKADNAEAIFEKSIEIALEKGYINSGDLIVITAGIPVGVSGGTNTMKVHIVSKVLLKGTSIGNNSSIGRVCIVHNAEEAQRKFRAGDIIVAVSTDKEMMPFIEDAAGVITEEGGLTSHAAIVGITLNKPTIVGAEDATVKLQDGMIITMDTLRGFVYLGKTSVF